MAPKTTDMDATAEHEEMHGSNGPSNDLELKEKPDPYVTDSGIEIDEATNRRLFWKVAIRIVPIQLVTYFCQSLDKGILNYASIMGITEDAHLVGQQVSPQLV